MVDWDRVGELRSKGWDWDEIAEDPKVGFHPDASAGEPGRALRALYHRQRSRRDRHPSASDSTPAKKAVITERRWTPIRLLYLFVPFVGFWALLAYLIPSPIGLLLPAIPWLGLATAVLAIVLIYLLLRADKRWTKVYRTTLIGGIALGIVFAGMVGLVATLAFGCPALPPASSLSSGGGGWASGPLPKWQTNGVAVTYFYGATWCPYCSASSWAVWKALTAFGSVSGAQGGYSYTGNHEPYPGTPEMILANAGLTSNHATFQVSEYVYGSDGIFPTTSNCYQSAYVTAYSGGSIPFVVVGGQYVHAGSSVVDPASLATWNQAANGWSTVYGSVSNETGSPWTSAVETPACWMIAYMAKAAGLSNANSLNLKQSTILTVNGYMNQI